MALARAASTARASRFPSPRSAALVSARRVSCVTASSRSSRSRRSLAICWERTEELSTFRTSIASSFSTRYLFTPITGCRPESMRACVRAAASSTRSFGMPASMACAMPPAASTSSMCCHARRARSYVSFSTYALPPHGSIDRQVPDSCCSSSWVLRAMRAEKSVGSASASSRALVCSDWVWPWVAAIASMQVRVTLLKTSCAVSDQPEVCECVRSDSDLAFFGSNCLTRRAHSRRAARSFATSMKKFMPIAQKNDRRGANASTSSPTA